MRNNKITEINRRLLQAATVGNVEDIRSLIGGGAEVNFQERDGGTALLNASRFGHADAIRKYYLLMGPV